MSEKPEYTVWKGLIKDSIKEAMAEDRQNIVSAAFEEKYAHLMAMRELEEERKDDDGFSSGTKCCPLCGKGRK